MKTKINHPLADTVSVVVGIGTYSTTSQSELAFFKDGEWVTQIIPEFENYHDGSPIHADTCVYPWVPNELVNEFLETYRV
jgi:hypothetical protein